MKIFYFFRLDQFRKNGQNPFELVVNITNTFESLPKGQVFLIPVDVAEEFQN